MKSTRQALIILLVASLALAAVTPIFAMGNTPVNEVMHYQEAELDTVRVGTIPLMIFAPLFVADVRGYFAEEGIQLELTTTPGGAEPLAPLARDELDVVMGGTGAGFFNYAARNIEVEGDPNFRIVSVAHIERPPLTTPLVVAASRFESGEITSVADLEGARVSINAAGAGTEFWLYRALEEGGLSMDDIELVAVAFGDVPAALNSEAEDRIDAAMLGEPITANVEAAGLIARLSSDFLEDFQGTFIYMSNSFVTEDRDVAVRFMKAFLRGARDLQDPATWEAEDVVAHLSEATLGFNADLLDTFAFPYFDPNGTVSVEDIDLMQQYFLDKEGSLAYDEPLVIEDLIDTSISADAVAEIGEYEEME
jgi:NitT/TauT family transport system substrate-binding protein